MFNYIMHLLPNEKGNCPPKLLTQNHMLYHNIINQFGGMREVLMIMVILCVHTYYTGFGSPNKPQLADEVKIRHRHISLMEKLRTALI